MARSAVTVDARVAVATLKRELSRRPSLLQRRSTTPAHAAALNPPRAETGRAAVSPARSGKRYDLREFAIRDLYGRR